MEITISEADAIQALKDFVALKKKIGPDLEMLEHLKHFIKARVIETGKPLGIDGAEATLRKGHTRVKWDGLGLEGYAVAYPEISEFASEVKVAPTVSIKLS